MLGAALTEAPCNAAENTCHMLVRSMGNRETKVILVLVCLASGVHEAADGASNQRPVDPRVRVLLYRTQTLQLKLRGILYI